MSTLRNSTYEAQPWWDYDNAVWEDITPRQPTFKDEYFGKKYWYYSSSGIDWPSSKLVREFVGSYGSPEIITIAGEFPAWTADVVLTCRSSRISSKFPAWTSSVHILTGKIISIASTFPKWTGIVKLLAEQLNISGKFPKWSSDVGILSGEILSISGEFPIWTSSISIRPNVGIFRLYGTFPAWSGITRLRQVVGVYAATVMNASNFAVTEYAQYPVSSIGYMNNHYYGTLSDGIYILEGDDDSGTDIDAEIETGPVDIWDGFVRYPREAWYSFRADGTIILRIRIDEQDSYEGEIAYLHERIREGRIKFGKGIRKRYAAFGFKNKGGSGFDLDNIRIMVDPVRTRAR